MMSQLTTPRRPSSTAQAVGRTAGARTACPTGPAGLRDAVCAPAPRAAITDARSLDAAPSFLDAPTSRDSFILGLISGAAGAIVSIAVIVILALANGG